MRLISCHDGKLLTLDSNHPDSTIGPAGQFSSGLAEWDALVPGGGFARGAIHELLTAPADGKALFPAMILAGAALAGRASSPTTPSNASAGRGRFSDHVVDSETTWSLKRPRPARRVGVLAHHDPSLNTQTVGKSAHPTQHSALSTQHSTPSTQHSFLIWCDPTRELYPPALAAHGFPLDRLLLLYPDNSKDLIWAMTECLRCKGVAAVVGPMPKLSRIEARRLQLAAETGGSVGLLLRPTGRDSAQHAAVSRWLIRPAPGAQTRQRWTIQLIHGHGGRIGQTLGLEYCRETNHLHPFDPMGDRQVTPGITLAG